MLEDISDISKIASDFKMFKIWLPFHISYGVLTIDFEGILFRIYAAVFRVYPQNYIKKSMKHIIDHTISNKV